MQITINFPLSTPPATPRAIFRARKWGDPPLVQLAGSDAKMLEDTDANGSNFQVVQLATYDPIKNFLGFGSVSQFQYIGVENGPEHLYLQGLQNADADFTVKQKMAWLINGNVKPDGTPEPAGRPMWWKIRNGVKWLVYGTMVFGGQLIEVESVNGVPVEYIRRGKFAAQPAGYEQDITFYKLKGIRRADFGKYTYASHPHLIQRATMVYGGRANNYSDEPRGIIYCPVFDVSDFPHNETTREPGLYIARDFLET